MRQFKYYVGQEITSKFSTIIVTGQYFDKTKRYTYECKKCGYLGSKQESDMERTGCSVCNGHKTLEGYNDIETTAPHIVLYLKNKADAKKYKKYSNKKLEIKCPICGYEKKMTVGKLYSNGFNCNRCGGRKSKNEDIVSFILRSNNVCFESEYSPEWAEKRRYDFYIPNQNLIIEVHGLQHYSKVTGNWVNKNQPEIDNLKRINAINNGIKNYMVIDCRKGGFENLKQSILNSEILKTLGLSVNWNDAFVVYSSGNKEILDLWNSGVESTVEIAKIIGMSRTMVASYLKEFSAMGLCYYNPKEVMRESGRSLGKAAKGMPNKSAMKPVKCLNTGEIFESATTLSKKSEEIFGVYLRSSNISMVCRKERKQYKGFVFEYI